MTILTLFACTQQLVFLLNNHCLKQTTLSSKTNGNQTVTIKEFCHWVLKLLSLCESLKQKYFVIFHDIKLFPSNIYLWAKWLSFVSRSYKNKYNVYMPHTQTYLVKLTSILFLEKLITNILQQVDIIFETHIFTN